MARETAPAAEQLIDQQIPVLDSGFVSLLDYMGTDARIARAARVSYVTGKTKSDDEKLIRYLMTHGHWSPFEQVQFTFHIKLPLFVKQQLDTYRAAHRNAMSYRYCEVPDEFYVPDLDRMRLQHTTNKQLSGQPMETAEAVHALMGIREATARAYSAYDALLKSNLAREVARLVLPQNAYTQEIWTIDLRNLMNVLNQRLDAHAQYEIREYAKALLVCAEAVCPIAMSAWATTRQ